MKNKKKSRNISALILRNNNQYIVFNKPKGLPLKRQKGGDISLQQMGQSYCKHPINTVHGLDRPCSGIVLFSKSKKTSVAFSKQFKNKVFTRKYLAVVPNVKKIKSQDTLHHYVYYDRKKNKSYVRDWLGAGGKESILHYKLLGKSKKYSLLEVELENGSPHQIRVQLSSIDCPIKGDYKYGAKRGNKDRSIHLHAWQVEFTSPGSNERVKIKVNPPENNTLWKYFSETILNDEEE